LYDHLKINNILVKEQFGFRDNLATETATYTLLNEIVSSPNNKILVGGLFCHLQKAFNSVHHDILWTKMEFYGISGIAKKLMISYFKNRYQRVLVKDNTLNKCFSEWVHVKHGAPQGSVLGPLLFLIYINDFSMTLGKLAHPILFADDTSIIISGINPVEFKNNFEAVITLTINWFNSNLLTTNYDKTHIVQFSTKKQTEIKIPRNFNKEVITDIHSTRFLGLILDSTLSWKDDIVELTSKLSKACYAITAIKPFVSLDVLKMTYFSYVHSIMSYGIIFGGNSVHSELIFKIQKRIIRIITNSSRHDSCHQLYKQLQILPF
jgi:hypothetical protein